jgi:quercetin dioxygenase-like cupin family protein
VTAVPGGYLLEAGEGRSTWFMDTRMTIKAAAEQTGGAFTLLEWQAPAGFGPPRHVHDQEDEAFFLLDGAIAVECGEQRWTAGPGSFVLLPRGVQHCFVVTDGPVRGLQITAPSGFEQYLDRLGRPPSHDGLPEPSAPDVPALAAAAADLGMRIVGPPMAVG